MKPEEIKLGDWMRMWMGEVPPEFLLEVVFRIMFLFLLLIVSMRLLGLRMSAQLDRIEMLALFSLAAAIGVPLQVPDKGLLPPVIIATVVVLVGRLITWGSLRSEKFEQITEDNYAMVVKDGVVQMKEMKKTKLTIDRLRAQLRSQGLRHMGEVKRLYFEANGSFSIIQAERPQPGLSILPDFDQDFIQEQVQTPQMVCCTCGLHKKENTNDNAACSNCGNAEWRTGLL